MGFETKPTKKAFVIGPMDLEGKDKDGIAYADQIYNIYQALTKIGEELVDQGVRLVVTSPDKRTTVVHDIPSFALGAIDECDFAVADISVRSPSVMYEIATLHCLGTPVLLIDRKPVKIEDAVYYLKDLTVHGVDSYAVDTLEGVLRPLVRALCGINPPAGVDFTKNKIKEYYDGIALVDVSAIMGIATSFFSNYLRFVLNPQGPMRQDHTIERLVIIEPEKLQNNFGAVVKNRLRETFGDRLTDVRVEGVFARPFNYFRVGSTIVEYPTPLDSLVHSPQFQKAADRLTLIDPDGSGAAEFLLLQREMIAAFRRNVNYLCGKNFDVIDPPDYIPIETFFAMADQIG